MINHLKKIEVTLIYATTKRQWSKTSIVNRGTNASEIIAESNFLRVIDELQTITPEELSIGVFSQRVELDYLLQEGDRLEIYRPLKADPKEVRRQLALIGKTMGKRPSRLDQKGVKD